MSKVGNGSDNDDNYNNDEEDDEDDDAVNTQNGHDKDGRNLESPSQPLPIYQQRNNYYS